jgi:membrane protease YdiL (CAAX protease family)
MADEGRSTARVFRFFAWVLALSIPFYVCGAFWPVRRLPFGLPVTVLMIVVPAAVATLATHHELGAAAARALWRRTGDIMRIRSVRWMAIAVLCMPAGAVMAYAVMRGLGSPLPRVVSVPMVQAPLIFAVYFFAAIFEEIGWTGYATEPLQRRYGVLGAGLAIGAVWALWHVPPWWLGQGHAPAWVIGQFMATVAMRVIMGWIYAYGGQSLFSAILFHAMINTSYSLFPNQGSHYDPIIAAAILAAVAGAAALSSFNYERRNGNAGRPIR